ncbi:MAG: sugar transferase [Burkholderiales bacterium]|nr:sugar transferase [Anaerolineae bacterium]
MTKRAFDVLMSAVALLLLSPVMIALVVWIRVTSPGPALYRAVRIGRYGEPFTLYKFRSMVADADRNGPGITTSGDTRITPIGRFLRRTKLDELPQFLNVLRGDMSLVGPRPEDPRYVALYSPQQREVLKLRPGITSLASVQYLDEEALLTGDDWETRYVQEVMPAKLALDLQYAQNPSLWADIVILWRTVVAVLR